MLFDCQQSSEEMPFRVIFIIINKYIHNNQVIEKLSDSYPIRSLAKFVTRVFLQTRYRIEDNLTKINKQEFIEDMKNKTNDNRLKRFSQRLLQEFKNEMNNAKEELKRKQR